MKKISIIGASGSIGDQTIDIITNNPTEYQLVAFAVGRRVEKIDAILSSCKNVEVVGMGDSENLELYKGKYPNIEFVSGVEGMETIAKLPVDMFVNAVVGSIGVKPTISAIKSGNTIGLANKETLVMAGKYVMNLAFENNVGILPIDSEHSAIFQCMNGENKSELSKLLITASGGSFRDYSIEQLNDVTVESALNHPNWNMGNKITIDSATMMNKGFEIIEAHHLFNVAYANIEVVVHKESIIHSMTEMIDGSVIAHMGTPDMRIPIQYALTYPKRSVVRGTERLNLFKVGQLNFNNVDFKKYKCLELAINAGVKGGNAPCILNAANEIAVEAFLLEKISFLDIAHIVEMALNKYQFNSDPSIDELLTIDSQIKKELRQELINE